MEVMIRLADMRENGIVNHTKTLSIPDDQRIPELAKENRVRVLTVITAALGSAFSNFNLRYGMNEDQIVELADAIIETSNEDKLSIEDVLLFLRDLVTGKAGKIYDRMDMPTFFEMFETYRQERYETLKNVKYERDAQYKSIGISERCFDDYSHEKDLMRSAISEHMKIIYSEKQDDENNH